MIASRGIASLFLLALCGSTLCNAQATPQAADAGRPQRLLFVEHSLLDQLGKLNQHLQHDSTDATTRDLTNASLLILRTNGSPAAAEQLMRRVFATQDMDPKSKGYGTVPWKMNDSSIKDPNAIEFTMQALGAVFLGYGDKLSPEFKKEIQEHLRAAMVALANHRVQVSYTNIFLMNTMSTIELAEYLGDADSLQRGDKQWMQWWSYTAANGIHEFDSPTYYAVDLGDLILGYLYVKDAAIHGQIKTALDMFWRDILSNYLLAAQHIAGAHSRDYYFLTGRGGIEYYLYMEGLFDPGKGKFEDQFLEKVDLLESEKPGGYRVPQEILDLAKLPERIVQQRWDQAPNVIRYNYLAQDYAIGFATGKYGDQDKMFAADLTAQTPLPSITLVPDDLDSPYGVKKALDRSGHSKPNHLPLNLSGVQEKGTAVLVADLDPTAAIGEPTYATNLVLPAKATRILLDKKTIKVSSSLDESAGENSVIGVRSGNACFVARILSVDKLNGSAPTIALKADTTGLSNDVLRLAIYHAQSSFAATDTRHLHVAFLVDASECKDDSQLTAAMQRLSDAQVKSSVKDGAWQGEVQVGPLKLAVAEDPTTRLPASASVNGTPRSAPVFTLNGRAMGLEIAGP